MSDVRKRIRARRYSGLLMAGALLSACGSPAPSRTDGPAATDIPSSPGPSQPEAVPAGTLTVAAKGPITDLSNAAFDEPTLGALPFIFNGLYRLDASFRPVPDLAAEPCDVSENEVTWTCTLSEVTFHDGTEVMADDVVYTYRLAMSPSCTFRPALCLSSVLESVEALDESTVVFTLQEPYAPFAALALAGIMIEPMDVIDGAFDTVAEDAALLDPGAADALADQTEELAFTSASATACSDAVTTAEALLAGVPGIAMPRRDDFNTGGENAGEFDPCAYGIALVSRIRAVIAAREPGIDAAAAAYPFLRNNTEPIGSGPWMCRPGCLRPGESLTLEAFAEHFRGPPATRTIAMPIIPDEAAAIRALREGEVDWVRDLYIYDQEVTEQLQGDSSVKLADYPEIGYFSLQYNLRPGQLFADLGTRKAVQHCIDKAAIVEEATLGTGIPMEGYLPPDSWAHEPNLDPVQRDTRAAMAFLREAGWTVDDADDDGIANGVATRGDARLSTNVYVRPGRPDRIAFMELVRDQVIECGIELEVVEPHSTLLPLLTYPHIAPNDEGQFDAYFGGWGTGPDPDPFLVFHSSQCTTQEQPDLLNYICFSNDEADRLMEEGRRVSDIDERTAIYQELEQLLHEEQPYLFAWSNLARDAVDANLASSAGELDLTSPLWHWQVETLIVAD